MWLKYLRYVALAVSLFLAVCLLDARGETGAVFLPSPISHQAHFSLDLSISVDKAAQSALVERGSTPWSTEFYRETVDVSSSSPRFGPERNFFRHARSSKGALVHPHEPTTSSLVNMREGVYWAVTRAAGFQRVAQRIELRRDTRLEVVLQLAHPLLVEVLAQGESVSSPLADATVLVGEDNTLPFGAQTDVAGQAFFESLGAGAQRVRIFAPGFEPYEAMAEERLLVQLRPVSHLRILVTSQGRPQPNAQVFVGGAQLWPARTTTTGADGIVKITGLSEGRYGLYAQYESQVSATFNNAEVHFERGIVDIELELKEGRFLSVVVQSADNEEPIADARITWSSTGLGQFSRHATTDRTGSVRLGPLAEKGGLLNARAVGFMGRIVSAEDSLREEGAEAQLISLLRSATLSGRVLDGEGFPVSGATVEVAGTDSTGMPISVTFRSDAISDAHFDWASSQHNRLIPAGELGVMLGPVPTIPLRDVPATSGRRLTTDSKGYFRIEGVPAGQVVVLARHPEHLDGRSDALTLSAGGRAEVELKLRRGRPLRGRVIDAAGFPVENARVHLSSREFSRRVLVSGDGTFDVPTAPHVVNLAVSLMDRPLSVVMARDVTRKERDQEVLIQLPAPRDKVELVILGPSDQVIPLAQVTFTSLSRQEPMQQTRFTQEDGSVEFARAAMLHARLVVRARHFVEYRTERTFQGSTKIQLMPAMMMHGRITGVRGRLPAAGAQVRFESSGFIKSVTADEFGEYQFADVPPGEVKLSASHFEHGRNHVNFRLSFSPTGEVVEAPTLDLLPTLQVKGRIVDGAGEAISGVIVGAQRLSPYFSLAPQSRSVAQSDELGEFSLAVEKETPLHLYGAKAAWGFGWSDALIVGERDRINDVVVVLDQFDIVPPDEMGTVLVGLLDTAGQPTIYVVARGSQAEVGGLRQDDILEKIDGRSPGTTTEARSLLSGPVGSSARITVKRGSRRRDLVIDRESFRR